MRWERSWIRPIVLFTFTSTYIRFSSKPDLESSIIPRCLWTDDELNVKRFGNFDTKKYFLNLFTRIGIEFQFSLVCTFMKLLQVAVQISFGNINSFICSANQWTGFYMIWTSVMKELITWTTENKKVSFVKSLYSLLDLTDNNSLTYIWNRKRPKNQN